MHSDMRRALRLLYDSAKADHRHLYLGALLLACAAGLEALGPLLSKQLIDNYLLPHRFVAPAMAGLWIIILVSGCAATVLRYLQLTRLAGVAMRSVACLRLKVFSHVMRLPMRFFDKAIIGQIVSRVTNDTESVKALYIQVLFVMLDSSIVIISAFVAMLWLEWRLALVALLVIPVVFVIVYVYQRLSAPAVARTKELRSSINALIAESVHGMHVLQASNAVPQFAHKFAQTNGEHYRQRLAELRANAWLLRPALDMLNVLLLVVVLYCFGTQRIAGQEIGILYAFVSYISRVIEPLIQITLQFSQLQQAVIGASRVDTLMQEALAPAPATDRAPHNGRISISKLDFAYEPGRPVLHDVNLDIPDGSFCAIVGHTGSGKSTLMALLLRFYPAPPEATIRIGDCALNDIGEDCFHHQVGLVPQDPYLLADTVRENIAMGRQLSDEQVQRAAMAAGIHDTIAAWPDAYATELGEAGARLSTGEKQLIAIARALAGQPRILLLDEATSHIDSATEQIVQTALTRLRGQITILAIAHRLSTIRDADQIVVLNHGRIAERGRHDTLVELEGGIYRRLYQLQQIDAEMGYVH